MGEVCFSDVGTSFLSGGVPHGGASVLMGGVLKKILGWGGCPPWPPPPTMGNPGMWYKNECKNKLILTKNGCGILILNCGFKMYLQLEQRQNVNYAKKQ